MILRLTFRDDKIKFYCKTVVDVLSYLRFYRRRLERQLWRYDAIHTVHPCGQACLIVGGQMELFASTTASATRRAQHHHRRGIVVAVHLQAETIAKGRRRRLLTLLRQLDTELLRQLITVLRAVNNTTNVKNRHYNENVLL